MLDNTDKLIAIFSEFVTGTMNGICVFDENDKVIFSNNIAAKMFGFQDHSAVEGKSFKVIITHCYHNPTGLVIDTDNLDKWLATAALKRRSENHRHFEVDLHNGNWYLISEQVVTNNCIVMISTDITDKKNAESRLTEMSKELFLLASTDALTNTYNRRHFIDQSKVEQKRCIREHYGYSLLMIDLDFFKHINDNFGHACGDSVLTTVASTIKIELREYDLLGRIGGEEFAVLLPNTTHSSAFAIAERIRDSIERLSIESKGSTLDITASIGVALDEKADKCLEDMFLDADKLLYMAKKNGRNQVVMCNDSAPP